MAGCQGKKACFLTGRPGTGKTTIIREVVRSAGKRAGGFFTQEVRVAGVRTGFRIVTLDGKETVLADKGMRSPHRVGSYGVNVLGLEEVGVPAIREAIRKCDIVVIDEIGKMELSSEFFKEAVMDALKSGKKVTGTIMSAPNPFADQIKRRDDVTVVTVERRNSALAAGFLAEWLEYEPRRELEGG
ncbi:MAG: NTPase [Dehalococcoidia bacterium]|nr:NTPase [Dehalococcoidia bacterium]